MMMGCRIYAPKEHNV